ncbi:MAG: hypothetical protein JSS67_02435 [Bacteroidetes bacterium]|nr:hypothetical protein [Bacteroidota bacterium]
MKNLFPLCILFFTIFFSSIVGGQEFRTVFENSQGKQSATYFECIRFYQELASKFTTLKMITGDTTDSGYPLNVVLYSNDKTFNPAKMHAANKIVILVNNDIHPGEPDGLDASMMLLRDLATGKIKSADNVVFAVIPAYNIGGALNRSAFSRVNQNGPELYGFRGNAENLDLNRDFIKADSRNAFAFEKIYQWLQPDVFLDNHVSDGADYQYTMTLLTSQHNKLGGPLGIFLHDIFEPALYVGMQKKNWPMTPYVNFEDGNADKGWAAFYDSPRYSSGYTTLFQTISFMAETHMLKPYIDRVHSTYALMQTLMEQSSIHAREIISKRKENIENIISQDSFALGWRPDTTHFEMIHFKGYEALTKTSDVTGMPRMYYDHSKPFEKEVRFYNTFVPVNTVKKPFAYIIPHGWYQVIDRLKLNGVQMTMLAHDTDIHVEWYRVEDYKSYPKPFEKHHINYSVKLSTHQDLLHFLKGDYLIYTNQPANRYMVETLEPKGDDSYFLWNFFDAILQEKEGYSNYRWEDVAAEYLATHPDLKQKFDEKRKNDLDFAKSADAQLNYIYKNSPYYEPAHLRYPVYRLLQ